MKIKCTIASGVEICPKRSNVIPLLVGEEDDGSAFRPWRGRDVVVCGERRAQFS